MPEPAPIIILKFPLVSAVKVLDPIAIFPFPSAIAIKSGMSRIVSRLSFKDPTLEMDDPDLDGFVDPNVTDGCGLIGDINGSSFAPAVKRGRHSTSEEEDLCDVKENTDDVMRFL